MNDLLCMYCLQGQLVYDANGNNKAIKLSFVFEMLCCCWLHALIRSELQAARQEMVPIYREQTCNYSNMQHTLMLQMPASLLGTATKECICRTAGNIEKCMCKL